MAYRFVHAADIHLDSPLKSLALRDPALAELIGTATRQAFSAVIDLCLDERVDALLLAGDLYDGEQTSMKTARFLAGELRRLDEAGIRTFVIRGNHDALSKITRELVLPASVKLFGGWAEAVALEGVAGGLDIRVHGLSFAQPQAPDSFLPRYKAPVEGAVNIGLMHTSLGGHAAHDPYAPCSEAELGGSGFSYWALGHIHARHAPRPATPRAASVVMPGIPQGRDINEAGPKSVTLVTVRDDRTLEIEERVTSVAQFERVRVDLGGVADWRGALDRLAGALGAARDRTVSPQLVARLELVGATSFAWQIRRDADRMRAEAALVAEGLGRTWIESLDLALTMPAAAAPADDAVAELAELIGTTILGSEGFRLGLGTVIEDLSRKLPRECRDAVLGADAGASEAALARLFAEGAEDVLARLREPAGAGPA